MGKKTILFVIIGVFLGVALAAGGIFFMINKSNEADSENKENIVEEFDLKDGKRLTLEKVQIPLKQVTSKTQYLQADFTIIFKDEKSLTQADSMKEDIKDAIMGVFENKTADELRGNRNLMKEPVLEAIRELYNNESDKENIVAVMIPTFIIT